MILPLIDPFKDPFKEPFKEPYQVLSPMILQVAAEKLRFGVSGFQRESTWRNAGLSHYLADLGSVLGAP